MSRVIRITMFKVPLKENQAKVLDLWRTFTSTAVKDGKPYILSLHAGIAEEDARSQGFTIVAKSEFASDEDMGFYDTDCEAHKVLKAGVKSIGVDGVMAVYYRPGVVMGTGM